MRRRFLSFFLFAASHIFESGISREISTLRQREISSQVFNQQISSALFNLRPANLHQKCTLTFQTPCERLRLKGGLDETEVQRGGLDETEVRLLHYNAIT